MTATTTTWIRNAAEPPPNPLTGAQMRKVIGSRLTPSCGFLWSITVEEVDGLLWASDAHNLLPASWLARSTVTGETPQRGTWLLKAKATTLVGDEPFPLGETLDDIMASNGRAEELARVTIGSGQAMVRVGPVRGYAGMVMVAAFERPDGELIGIREDYLKLHLGARYNTGIVTFHQLGAKYRPIVIRRGESWSVAMPIPIPGQS